MVEAFDAPMLDYSTDLDIPMQPSTAEHWTHDEAIMEDDHPPHHHHSSDPMQDVDVLVEVDMDAYEDVSVEYDMTDGLAHDGLGRELQDVEVFDASRLNSPQPVFTSLPELHNPSHASSEGPPTIQNASNAQSILETDEVLHMHSSPLPGVPLEQDPVAPAAEVIAEQEPGLRDEGQQESSPLEHQNTDLPRTPQSLPVFAEETAGDNTPAVAGESLNVISAQPSISAELTASLASLPSADLGASELEPTSSSTHEGLQGEVPAEQESSAIEPNNVDEESPGDPHEISEGVYIDPPPPVYLSTSEQVYYLFNQPSAEPDADRNTSPSSSNALHNSTTEYHVLLHQQPTLYYDTISTLFEVLRQESALSTFSGSPDGELILNAYQLGLILSEDNVYAREITLHDLNLIHDESNLPGPLRLQLQMSTPRFITRYRQLQLQFADLHTHGDEYAEGVKVEPPTNEATDDYDKQNAEAKQAAEPPVAAVTAKSHHTGADNAQGDQAASEPVSSSHQLPEYLTEPSIEIPAPIDGSDTDTGEGHIPTHPTGEARETQKENEDGAYDTSDLPAEGHPEAPYEEYQEQEQKQAIQERPHVEELQEGDQPDEEPDEEPNEAHLPPLPDDSFDEDEDEENTVEDGQLLESANGAAVEEEVQEEGPISEPGNPLSKDEAEEGKTVEAVEEDHSTPRQIAPALESEAGEDLQSNYEEFEETQYEEYEDVEESTTGEHQLEAQGGAVPEDEETVPRALEFDTGSNNASNPQSITLAEETTAEDLDGEWDAEYQDYGEWEEDAGVEQETASTESSTTLSSKASVKRSFDEFEADEFDVASLPPLPSSPDSKRPRVQ
ncbi:hypothetical protein AX16_008679 [Volvariella volvacea WC 439]|nr:hypothetical protein AX16_008679 [Volvariella volvacea WC 439]